MAQAKMKKRHRTPHADSLRGALKMAPKAGWLIEEEEDG